MRYIKACIDGAWCLEVWDKENIRGPHVVIPFRCNSWRHDGQCCLFKGWQDFTRVKAALESRWYWTYMVLTFDQKDFLTKGEQWIKAKDMWAKLRKRIERHFGRTDYIQTWERFLKGGAHCNIALANFHLWKQVDKHDREAERSAIATFGQGVKKEFRTQFERNWLEWHAVECGFGKVVWADRIDNNAKGMAGYLCSKAAELTGAGIKDQRPLDAPPHFRRLRASRGLLPKLDKSGLTGHFHKRRVEEFAKLWGIPFEIASEVPLA